VRHGDNKQQQQQHHLDDRNRRSGVCSTSRTTLRVLCGEKNIANATVNNNNNNNNINKTTTCMLYMCFV